MSGEINPTFSQLNTMFNRIGIWQDEEESELRRRRWKLFHTISYLIFLIVLMACAIMSYIQDESLFAAQAALAGIVLFKKLHYLLWEKDNVSTFLRESVIDSSTLDSEEKIQIGKKITIFMKFSNAYSFMMNVTCTSVVIFSLPIFTGDKKLPLYINFGLDCKHNEALYWMTYIVLTWGTVLSGIANSFLIIIWYILLKLSLQYKLLGNRLRKLGVNRIQKTEKQNAVVQDLIGLVKTHRNLYEKTERFRSSFHNIFLTQIVISGIYICTATYVLAFDYRNNFVETLTYIITLIYGIVNIFLVMYFANEITLYSDRLSYCLFESNWVEQSRSYKKCFIILCEVLKQPQVLVIRKLYPMNLETFTSIMNSAYSMFNILKSLK